MNKIRRYSLISSLAVILIDISTSIASPVQDTLACWRFEQAGQLEGGGMVTPPGWFGRVLKTGQ